MEVGGPRGRSEVGDVESSNRSALEGVRRFAKVVPASVGGADGSVEFDEGGGGVEDRRGVQVLERSSLQEEETTTNGEGGREGTRQNLARRKW